MNSSWDCIVVGGGAAGLSAGLVLGRARRRTLVIDAESQSNRVADGFGGLLGHDSRPATDFYAAGRAELAVYPSVELRFGEAMSGERSDDGFTLELADGRRETARCVLLATGMDYRYPALPGIEERWGRSVFHCPLCHGWEHRDEPLGVLDRGAAGVHRALLLRGWSNDVTLLTDGDSSLEPDDADRLGLAGVAVDARPVAGLRGPSADLTMVASPTAPSGPVAGCSCRSRCLRDQRARPIRGGRRERGDAIGSQRGRLGPHRRRDARWKPPHGTARCRRRARRQSHVRRVIGRAGGPAGEEVEGLLGSTAGRR